ncbi:MULTISPECIES: hypothetical protein [Microbulbifer]|uniref:hypothetical protein n=1 Tax=Microbulbifer TaxID=48073 RepID=UPI001E5C2B5C|nr:MULTISPECIES: hypothetical protein [Microbulbifer]UHQ55891.1 hypothetical protein LVE68_02590 [Microbulbifer sp. YPW16]
MRYFPILVFFVLAFGGAAVFYEKESRKVKGVLSQITDLQAKVGDLQAEVKQLRSELEASQVAERRRPSLRNISQASARRSQATRPAETRQARTGQSSDSGLVASDVTSAGPAISREAEDDEWARPTMDADEYRPEGEADTDAEPVTDPYQ